MANTETQKPVAKSKKAGKDKAFNYSLPDGKASAEVSGKHVTSLITKAHKAAGSYRNAVQLALVGICFHAWKHGDWTGINTLIDGMPKGVGTTGIVKYAQKFIGLSMVDDPDNKGEKKLGGWKGRDHIERLFNGDVKSSDKFEKAGAKGTMFWEFAEPSPFKGFDFNKAILVALSERAKVIKRMNDPKSDLTEEDKAKIIINANEATIQNLLKVTNFEVILNGKPVLHEEAPAVTSTPAEKAPASDDSAAQLAVVNG